MYQTIAVAVVVLMLGNFLKHRIAILERFCIPAPVIGGVIFAIFTCVCYVTGFAEFSFDDILKEVCMVFFFTSVGFQANLKVLKSGGKSLIIFLILVIMLIICQNFLAVGLSKALQISPLVGLCTGNHHTLPDDALPVMLIHAHMIQTASSAIVSAEYGSNYLSIFYRYNTRSWISLEKSKNSLSRIVNRTDSKAVDGLPEAVHLVIVIYRHNPYFIFIL